MEELLHHTSKGDEAAFSRLYRLYKNKVYTVALKLTESSFMAEEVVQDVFLKVWIRRETLASVRDFEDYLFIMTRNHVFTAWKRSERRQSTEGQWQMLFPESTNSAEHDFTAKEYQATLQKAIDLLPEQQKQVYLLSREQELKREEIARLLQISPETVKTHMSRAVRYIRAYCVSRLELTVSWLLLFWIG